MNKLLSLGSWLVINTVLVLFLLPTVVHAATSIRIEQPKSPTNDNDFKINFVTLDTENQPVTAKCFKKGPADSDFVQFGSDINFPAGTGGGSRDCQVNSSIMSTQGSYKFKAKADGSEPNKESSIVTVDYKTDVPGTPYNYSKERFGVNLCDYTIRFKTAADGGITKKVEIYMSSLTSFPADSGTRVGTVSIGSDQEGHFTTTAPDCSKTFYFAIRAFDDAGNGSGVVGDSVVTVTVGETTTVISQAPTTTGAIPVATSQVTTTGEILGVGAEEEATKEGEVQGEATPAAQEEAEPSPSPFGPQAIFTPRNFLLALAAITVLGGIYLYRRFRQ